MEFDTTPIPKLVLRLGIPAMFAQCFNILYSIVDRAFVGHMATGGEAALASIGLCAPILTAITAFSSLVGIGGASSMSILIGQRDLEKAKHTMHNAFFLLLFISGAVTVLLLLFQKPLLYTLGCSDALFPYASQYFGTYVLGTAAVLCGTGMNQFILAFGNAKRGMFSVMLGAIINTILAPIFIYVLGLGIQGAAIATVLAQLCVACYVLSFLFSRKPVLRLGLSRLSLPIIRRILTVGSLPCLIMLFDNLLVISLNFVLQKYGGPQLGDQYISCAAVVQSFMVLVFYPAQGITTGCGTLYSYHYGAGNPQKVMQVFRSVFWLCAGYMLLLCVAAQCIPETFARIFVQDETTVALSAACIQKYTLGLLGVAVQYAIVDGLTAMGQVRFALPISFFRKILYLVCVFLLPLCLPLEEVFYAETISDIAGASVTAMVFLTKIRPRLLQKNHPPKQRRAL